MIKIPHLFLFFSILFPTFTAIAELNLKLPRSNSSQIQISGTSGQFSSTLEARKHGLRTLRKFRRTGQIIEDPEVNLWIRSIGNKLVSRALQSTSPFYFLVSKDTSINAFATEGGVIVVNAGLILKSDSESEIAAVIAHEIAHITQRHISRMRDKAKANKLGTNAALIAGMVASSQDSHAGQAIINTVMATMAHKQLSFGREAESEADREGLRILTRAGFNPNAMPSILQKLEQFADTENAEIREFLQNHPLTHRRVTDTLARAKKLGQFRGKESKHYLFMREKIRANTNTLLSTPNRVPTYIKNYSKAQKLFQRKSFIEALRIANLKGNHVPENVMAALLFNKTKQYKKSLAILLPLYRLYPNNEPLALSLAQTYAALGKYQEAWKLLKKVTTSEQTSLEFFEVKQNIAQRAKQPSQAYYASAQRNLRIANYEVAIVQIKKAIKLSRDSHEVREMKRDLLLINTFKKL